MRLHWKFILIIVLFTLLAFGVFFVFDYYSARQGLNVAYRENFRVGIHMTKVAELVKQQMAKLYNTTRIAELMKQRMSSLYVEPDAPSAESEIPFDVQAQNWLNTLPQSYPVEMQDVLNIHVTDYLGLHFSGLEAPILASLRNGEQEREERAIRIDEETYGVLKRGAMYVGELSEQEYRGQRVSYVMVPYVTLKDYWVREGDDTWEQEDLVALVQVIFSTEPSWLLLNNWRMKHLVYVLIVSLLLQLTIIPLALYLMVSRPLQRIITSIERAREGDLEIRQPVKYAWSEFERLTLSLYQMLGQIRVAERERLAALGTLVAGVAHEIGNPLNTIAITAQYLKNRLSSSGAKPETLREAQESLDAMLEEVDALAGITQRLRELTRPTRLEREPTDVNEVLDSVIASLSPTLRASSVEVVRDYDVAQCVSLDPNKLRQAFVNIIQNAVQAMSSRGGGRLYLTTGLKQGITGEWLIVAIRDTGPGMPTHVQERIFEAYFTTRENEGGLGLGLTITRQIIQAHDGQIEVRSQEGMGTAFTISLPIPEESTDHSS